jgi:hypothetical protein
MKHLRQVSLAVVAVVVLGAGGFLWASHPGRSTDAATTATTPSPARVLAVDDLQQSPERFSGPIRVLGVVGGTKGSDQMFGLVDTREVEKCGTTTCAEFLLPVRWSGAMPKTGDRVTVSGKIQRSAQGLILQATAIDTQ